MYLLDTNVVSELRKVKIGRADPRVVGWAETIADTDMFLSVITIQELELGTLLAERKDQRRGVVLRAWLETQILPGFAGRIHAVDMGVARLAAGFSVPNPKPLGDALIAATALVHGLTVVTRDVADFVSTGVRLLNPWDYSTLRSSR